MDAEADIRTWARIQLKTADQVPIPPSDFGQLYKDAMEEMVKAVEQTTVAAGLHFTTELVALWTSFADAMRFIPLEHLTSSSDMGFDMRRIVTGHLHDSGPRQSRSISVRMYSTEFYRLVEPSSTVRF
jgi:senataxin